MASLYAATGDGFARLDEAGEAWTAAVRTLVGGGSPIQLGTPALILDVELSDGGRFTTPVPPEFQAFAYVLDGAAEFGANTRRATHSQVVLLVPARSSP